MLELVEHLVSVKEFVSVFGKLKSNVQKGRNKNNASHRAFFLIDRKKYEKTEKVPKRFA